MAKAVGHIMAEHAQGKGILLHVEGVTQHPSHEVASADVVQHVGKLCISQWVIANIQHGGAAVGEGMSAFELLWRGIGKTLEERRNDFGIPGEINHLFMGEDRVSKQERSTHE